MAVVQNDGEVWRTKWPAPKPGSWHYLELAWSKQKGLRIYQDLQLVAHQPDVDIDFPDETEDRNLYIGRGSTEMRDGEKFLNGLVDEVGCCDAVFDVVLVVVIVIVIRIVSLNCPPSRNCPPLFFSNFCPYRPHPVQPPILIL